MECQAENKFLTFLTGLLGHDPKQLDTFLLWFRGIHFDKARPRQCLVIAGEAGCGKSLLQKIITHTLGGRTAKPYSFLTGRTEFNSDLFGAEHLIIDDESASTAYRSRENLGNQIKQIVAVAEHRLHAKGKDAMTLCPWWVLTISLNDEPENLMVLPRIEPSLEDKIILLQGKKSQLPMPTDTGEQRLLFWEALIAGVRDLLKKLAEIYPQGRYVSGRFVVKSYHHPSILRALKSLSKEEQLRELIDIIIKFPRTLSAKELEGLVRKEAPKQADRLFTFDAACGSLLGRLAKEYPHRIKNARTGTARLWKIYPLESEKNQS